MSMWQIWLILSGIFVVIEAVTVGFLFFWFAVGALIALVSSLFISNVLYQAYIFLISSSLLIIFTKPLVSKFKNVPDVKTNAFSIVDKVGKVTVDIDPINGKGQVKVNGDTWSAKSINDEPIPVGTEVIIERIDGVKVLVRKAKQTSVI